MTMKGEYYTALQAIGDLARANTILENLPMNPDFMYLLEQLEKESARTLDILKCLKAAQIVQEE